MVGSNNGPYQNRSKELQCWADPFTGQGGAASRNKLDIAFVRGIGAAQ